MAYHDDLLDQAQHLARRDTNRPKQANLRRAVSTAYYALFHLLVSEAVGYWRVERHRELLARSFEHGKMKNACKGCKIQNAEIEAIAEAFVGLQQARHTADYDNWKVWTKFEAMTHIEGAKIALEKWDMVKNQDVAQDFLLSLFVSERK